MGNEKVTIEGAGFKITVEGSGETDKTDGKFKREIRPKPKDYLSVPVLSPEQEEAFASVASAIASGFDMQSRIGETPFDGSLGGSDNEINALDYLMTGGHPLTEKKIIDILASRFKESGFHEDPAAARALAINSLRKIPRLKENEK